MSIRRLIPDAGGSIDADAPDARTTLLDWYHPDAADHLRLNLVSTLDGRAAGPDGTSESLTSPLDRTILGVIRELADGVLVGAESVRREGYRRPRRCALAVLTASGDLRGHRLDERSPAEGERGHPILVLTTPAGAARAAESLGAIAGAVEIVVLAADDRPQGFGERPHDSDESRESHPAASPIRIDPTDVVSILRDRGWRRIVCEGGPALVAQLLSAGLVDELCLSQMPRLGGPALPLFGEGALEPISLKQTQLLVDDDGAQFGRWALSPRH